MGGCRMLNYIKILWVNCEECEAFLATVSVSQLCAKNIIKNKKNKKQVAAKVSTVPFCQPVRPSVRQSVSQSDKQTRILAKYAINKRCKVRKVF